MFWREKQFQDISQVYMHNETIIIAFKQVYAYISDTCITE